MCFVIYNQALHALDFEVDEEEDEIPDDETINMVSSTNIYGFLLVTFFRRCWREVKMNSKSSKEWITNEL